ncbi:MAG: phage major capsid protein [Nitriliruptoraceae bacterium]|nr:phage major capsid protein [Nitriliruptoraceae bacterium]
METEDVPEWTMDIDDTLIRDNLQDLEDRRDAILRDLHQAQLTRSAGGGERVDNLNKAITNIDRERTKLETKLRLIERARNGQIAMDSGSGPDGDAEIREREGRTHRTASMSDDQRTALRMIEGDRFASDQAKELGTTVVERDPHGLAARWARTAADPAYATAFAKLVADPERGHLEFSSDEQRAFARARHEQRAMAIGSGSAGGFMVPFALDPAIALTNDGSINPIREVARTVTTIGSQWAGVTSAGVTSSWTAEGDEVGDNSPPLAQPDIAVHKASTFVPFSFEAEGDAVDLLAELSRIMADQKAIHEAEAFVNGDGSGKPHGLVARLGAGQTVPTATAGTFAADDVYKLSEALPARFRPNARYLGSLPILNALDQFETGNGAKKFPSVANDPAVLLRRPLHEVSEMADDPTVEGANIMVVGDLSNYIIVDRIGSTMEMVPHLFGEEGRPTGQRGALLWWRVGADVFVPNAFRRLQVAAAG